MKSRKPAGRKRELGTLKGKVWIAPDAFSEELDQEISDSIEANQTLKKPQKRIGKPYRQLGTMRGKIWIGPDAFSPETEAEIADLMINGKIFPDD